MKKLDDLRFSPKWVSHLGCIKGCLDHLGMDVSDGWLFGATGYAFALNIHDELCPSGPTAWNTERIAALGSNIGYDLECMSGMRSEDAPDPGLEPAAVTAPHSRFAALQRKTWDFVRDAIDEGVPCYGWELVIPEFYVIHGYENDPGKIAGYLYSGPDARPEPKPWQELGDTDIGVIEICAVRRGTPADDARTVREALAFALEIADSPPKWINSDYRAGSAGYGVWIKALEKGKADGFGAAYNAAVWAECRRYAPIFLREAKHRIGRASALFEDAVAHYGVVANALATVADIFPFRVLRSEHIVDPWRVKVAVECLHEAHSAEVAGLATLSEIVATLA